MASIRSWLAGDDVSVVSVRSWLDSHGGRPEASVITWLSSYQSADGSHDGDGHMMSCGISDAASWLAVEESPSVWLGVEEHMDHMGHMVRASLRLAPCPPGPEQKVCCFRWFHGESRRTEWLCLTHDGQFLFRRITAGGHLIWSCNLTDFQYDFLVSCPHVHQTVLILKLHAFHPVLSMQKNIYVLDSLLLISLYGTLFDLAMTKSDVVLP